MKDLNHTPTRCKECRWVHEADTIKKTSYQGVEFCKAHDRAVNSHDALLRELKSALFYIHTYGGDVTTNFECGGNIETINKVIAKAEAV